MRDLMEITDPAQGHSIDGAGLRRKVDQKIAGLETLGGLAGRRPLTYVLAGFLALFVALSVPVLLRQQSDDGVPRPPDGPATLPGIETVVPLASGGVQTGAIDGNTIWMVTALAGQLQKIDANTGELLDAYGIDGHVEGVIVGANHLWLLSYSNEGEVLRFDPTTGAVDLRVKVGGLPLGAEWFAGNLWVSNDRSEMLRISPDGEMLSMQPGAVKGTGLGFLWINDPTTDLITSVSADGTVGEIVIPTDGQRTVSGADVREVTQAGGDLWLSSGAPTSTAVLRYDPQPGTLDPLPVAVGSWSPKEFNGFLWLTSRFDNVLVRIDPSSGATKQYPLPGKPGGLLIADGALWVALYQPGTLMRLDVNAQLIETGPIVVSGGSNGHHLVCYAGASAADAGPTIILEGEAWANYGYWSVVQSLIAHRGYRACADGYLSDDLPEPEQRAADLARDLDALSITGPYMLVGAGDGVHTVRLFVENRSDVVGVVLVDPMPIGFESFYDSQIGDSRHPPWLDLRTELSDSLTGLSSIPLVVIGQGPTAVYGAEKFINYSGGTEVRDFWQDGLSFYESLSSASRSVTSANNGLTGIVWNEPDLIVRQTLSLVAQLGLGSDSQK
ncbi:MAG: hypothetical protein OEY55_00615 [Acidimicrobiia bacterium]|nr:hypothetical protein [Acidimicrobiia bacterium]